MVIMHIFRKNSPPCSHPGAREANQVRCRRNLNSNRIEHRSPLDSIAEELNLSRRTVYRKLKAENISYKDLLIDSKKKLAREYLKNSSLSVYDIAVRLGFSEASSFHRAFKSWFGISPGRYRWID